MPRTSPLLKVVLFAVLLALLCVAGPGSAAAVPEAPATADAAPATLGATNVFPITTSSFEAIHHLPAIAYNTQRDEFLVVWHTEYALGGTRDVWGQFVRKNGQLMGAPFAIASETNMHNFQPAVAYDFNWNRYLVVWVRSPNADGSGGDIYGRFIYFNGSPGPFQPFAICDWPTSQWGPKIAYTVWPIGTPSFMVVWWTDPGLYVPNYVSGRKIDEFGTMGGTISISPPETPEDRHMPDIAATPLPWPNRYLVVYEMMHDVGANSEVRGRFVDVNGNPQGEEFAISDSGDNYGLQKNAAVASCGNEFAVIYQRSVNNYDIYLQFIDLYGYKLGGIMRLAWTTAHEEDPDVACGGDFDRYLATWSQEFAGVSGIGITSALVFADGKFGPYKLLMRPEAGPLNRYHPAVASDFQLFTGGHYGFLVAAEAQRPAGMMGIYGVTVLTSGTWLPVVRK